MSWLTAVCAQPNDASQAHVLTAAAAAGADVNMEDDAGDADLDLELDTELATMLHDAGAMQADNGAAAADVFATTGAPAAAENGMGDEVAGSQAGHVDGVDVGLAGLAVPGGRGQSGMQRAVQLSQMRMRRRAAVDELWQQFARKQRCAT